MASSDWYLTHPEWAIPGKAPIMSVPYVTMPNMDLDLERLIASHDTPGDTYPDLLAVTAYRLTTRPGDIDRCANAIHQLVTEIAGHRTGRPA